MSSPISPTKHVVGLLEASTRVSSSTKKYGRGIRAAILSVICAAAGVSGAHATTVSWGSQIFSDFRTSDGQPLGDTFVDEGFTIQLGYFADTLPGVAFIPNAGNVANWITQWRVFDQATLNLGLDYFTSEAEVNQGGGTSSTSITTGTVGANFEGETAYIWIRNSSNPVPGTEWFLATAATWTFPIGSDDCCDPVLPVQFSLTDLNPGAAPVFGGQNGQIGAGVYTDPTPTNPYDLQTYTFVPEPSSLLLTLAGSCLLLIRRRPAA